MTTTTDVLPINQFDRLPDELVEKIFFSFINLPPLTPNNHIRLGPNSLYFDYSIQQPLLKQNHTDLLQASLICRRFHRIIKSSQFWEQKCHQEHLLLPDQNFPSDFTAYEKLYVNNPFHPSFNLLKEVNWRKSRGTDSQIEPVPFGSHRLYDEFNRLSPCRATSYSLAQFFQRDVQLPCSSPDSSDLFRLRPVIEFSVCVAARWDCGSRCEISLVFSDGHRWQRERRLPQWNDKKWHRLIYRYEQYEQFPSSVTVRLAGCDTQFWAGYFGIKFAQPRLRLLLRTSEDGTNEESEVVIEPKPEDELIQEPSPDALPDNLLIDENPTDGNSPASSSSFESDLEMNEDEDIDDTADI